MGAVVEVEVHEGMDILGLEAADLKTLQTVFGRLMPRGMPSARSPLLEKPLSFHVAAHRRIRG